MHRTKVALITGAATGIGRACAERLAADDFFIAANYRSKKKEIEVVLAGLKSGNHFLVEGDLLNPEVPRKVIDAVIEKFGRIDVLVNSAGIFAEHDITSISYDDWRESWRSTIEVNLHAPMNLAFCAAQRMIAQQSGVIINITSRGAFRGEPNAPAYGASKSGLNSASQSLAKALAPHGISVFAIAPGWIDTPLASPYLTGQNGDAIRAQSPLNRVGTPEEIAHIVSFLSLDPLKTEFLTGAIIDANGASYLRN